MSRLKLLKRRNAGSVHPGRTAWIKSSLTYGRASRERLREIGVPLILLLCFLLLLPGCSRKKYREQADSDVYDLLNTADEVDPLWKMDGFSLNENANSRYANLYDPDKQPMPPDDGTSQRLMQCVDGKKGSKKWYKNGCIQSVDNDSWMRTLPAPVDGKIIIDQKVAFDLAVLHSPEYRTALENIYLAALCVTGERYEFDVHYYGNESLLYNNKGMFRKDSTGRLTNEVNSGANRAFAAGGQFTADLFNSLVWTFTPEQGFSPTTTLSYSFTQPFLRGAGRMIVLENLTGAERRLLANVRQLVFYQQGFYVKVLTGGSPVNAPSSASASSVSYPGSGVSGSANLGGFFGLLSQQVKIRNQQQNVASLQDNLNRYEELFKAGQVSSRTQVDRVRQSLLSGQSSLLSLKDSYEEGIDSYFVSILGLPPGVENIDIKDQLLNQFNLMPELLSQAQEYLNEELALLRDTKKQVPDDISEFYNELKEQVKAGEDSTLVDIENLQQKILPERSKAFAALEVQLRENPEIDASYFTPAMLQKRIQNIRGDYDRQNKELDDYGNPKVKGVTWVLKDLCKLLEQTFLKYDRPTLTKMIRDTLENPGASPFSPEVVQLIYDLNLEGELVGEGERTRTKTLLKIDEKNSGQINETDRRLVEIVSKNTIPPALDDPWRDWLQTCLIRFGDELMTLRLVQARARLESLQLSVVDINSDEAFNVAAEYRLDWMNERSKLVDNWRNIEIVADRLKADLDISVSSAFTNEGLNPLNFSAKNSSFTASMKYDAPLDRFLERNSYRNVLISYDQSRRSYYYYVDNVHLGIRNMIRSIKLAQADFELSRENVLTAIEQVHQSQLALTQPPSGSTRIGSISSTAAMDLVDALDNLLNYQNTFMQSWLQYRSKKMYLLLMLGLFEIDQEGRWIDPGNIDKNFLQNKMAGIIATQDALAGLSTLPPVTELTGGRSLEQILQTPAVDAGNADNTSPTYRSENSRSSSVGTASSRGNGQLSTVSTEESSQTQTFAPDENVLPAIGGQQPVTSTNSSRPNTGNIAVNPTVGSNGSSQRSGSIF